ncbi:unnamed protein product, partial [Lasius platythorax]
MYRRAQICIYYLLCIVAVDLTHLIPAMHSGSGRDAYLEITTTKSRDCPLECICLSPKQVLCNTG